MAMGSPVSVTVVDLVMEDEEQRALSTFPTLPRFWKHYVDFYGPWLREIHQGGV